MLNAFRHHRNSHLQERFVLNAFRHHRNSHVLLGAAVYVLGLCSTPFGIIGILTDSRVQKSVVVLLCSTPFGIIGILTYEP